jgi:hypothetical protein
MAKADKGLEERSPGLASRVGKIVDAISTTQGVLLF